MIKTAEHRKYHWQWQPRPTGQGGAQGEEGGREKGSTLYATLGGHFFPKPKGGHMCSSIWYISRYLIRPLRRSENKRWKKWNAKREGWGGRERRGKKGEWWNGKVQKYRNLLLIDFHEWDDTWIASLAQTVRGTRMHRFGFLRGRWDHRLV